MAAPSRLARPTGSMQTIGAAVLLLGSAATVGTALLFEHVGGYIPCALCLQERWPYYVSIVLAAVALVAAAGRAMPWIVRGLLWLIAAAMLVGLCLAIYHAGVEWHFWAGPSGCAAGNADLSGDLLSTIDTIRPPACDTAAGRFLGLSFAGWNVVASLLFAGLAIAAATGRGERRV
ncbi:disulfide bond formation protein B [Aureimonas sp. SA4125]|uniref:disulfide bond formation protein B n=1 Tax=Aureimonas sp. SA4125 TaxID=2826993 RepID=UPI001CC3DE30|nr:disulfide bond formation protein B [Aureimonas sp. SA4125]BDA86166.1 disulfide bond formation protein B [Aureimonas sp. SA4125]